MENNKKYNLLAKQICRVDEISNCPFYNEQKCKRFRKCFVVEKTEEQLDYIISPIDENIYLEACAGSGKTEALALKAAYELSNWNSHNSGIAFLSFTNDAKDTIADRINKFCHTNTTSKHFIGTFSSFVHQHISQPFGYYHYDRMKLRKDASFSIVDKETIINSQNWLKHYKVNFPSVPGKEIYSYRIVPYSMRQYRVNPFVAKETDSTEYYYSKDLQAIITDLRYKKKNDNLFKYDYFLKQIDKAKRLFNSFGFANFEDMSFIAVEVLKNNELSKLISKRFPIIFVDECQDLALVDLMILYYLIKAGTKVHLIGDLNQAIYSFNQSFPERTKKFVDRFFNTYYLTYNFRSTQYIVDFSVNLRRIKTDIRGTYDGSIPPLYFEYNNEGSLVEKFEKLLNKYSISLKNSIVLSRSQSIIEKIKSSNNDLEKHYLIKAIQLWQRNNTEDKREAMLLISKDIIKWMSTTGMALQYYCPKEYCEDVFKWRLALRNILNRLCKEPSIGSFSGLTYSEWYKTAKGIIPIIINEELKNCFSIKRFDFESIKEKIKAPQGTAKKAVSILNDSSKIKIRIKTVHSAKGETYDAVLFVSGKTKNNKESYWENWLDPKTEPNRIAYVASTRPRLLLCWALPEMSDEEKLIINGLGMIEYCSDE